MVLHSLCMLSAVALSGSVDTCNEEEVSLMQGRQLMVGRSTANVRAHNSSATQLLESAKQMTGSLNSMKRIDDDAVTSFRAAIAAAIEVITSSKGIIDQEHADAQTRITAAGDAMHQCASNEVTGEGAVGWFDGQVQQSMTMHQTCRHEEQSLTETRDRDCSELHEWMEGFVVEAGLALSLRHEDADTLGPELLRVKNFASSSYDLWEEKHSACETAESNLANHPQRHAPQESGGGCAPEQSNFEGLYCQRLSTCLAFEDCWMREKGELEDLMALETTELGLRQDQFVALHHSECLLELIQTAISADPPTRVEPEAILGCEETHTDSGMSFNLPDTTEPTYCDAIQAAPEACSADFFDAQYGQFTQRDQMEPLCTACQHPDGANGGSGDDNYIFLEMGNFECPAGHSMIRDVFQCSLAAKEIMAPLYANGYTRVREGSDDRVYEPGLAGLLALDGVSDWNGQPSGCSVDLRNYDNVLFNVLPDNWPATNRDSWGSICMRDSHELPPLCAGAATFSGLAGTATTFFHNLIGSRPAHIPLGSFESLAARRAEDGTTRFENDRGYFMELIDCPSRVIRATVEGGHQCGAEATTVQFRINEETYRYFKDGVQAEWQPICDASVISGTMAANIGQLTWIWTGNSGFADGSRQGNAGWHLSGDGSGAGFARESGGRTTIFASGSPQWHSNFNACNGGQFQDRVNNGETVTLQCVQ